MSTDRYAHLRANLDVHRAMTSARLEIAWCRDCEWHLADESGYCPLCLPATTVASPEAHRSGSSRAAGDTAA